MLHNPPRAFSNCVALHIKTRDEHVISCPHVSTKCSSLSPNDQSLTKTKSFNTQLCRSSGSIKFSQLTILLRNTTMCGLGCEETATLGIPGVPKRGCMKPSLPFDYPMLSFFYYYHLSTCGLEAFKPIWSRTKSVLQYWDDMVKRGNRFLRTQRKKNLMSKQRRKKP